jgi:hypothetical protein
MMHSSPEVLEKYIFPLSLGFGVSLGDADVEPDFFSISRHFPDIDCTRFAQGVILVLLPDLGIFFAVKGVGFLGESSC